MINIVPILQYSTYITVIPPNSGRIYGNEDIFLRLDGKKRLQKNSLIYKYNDNELVQKPIFHIKFNCIYVYYAFLFFIFI